MRESISRCEHLPLAVFVQTEAILRRSPDAASVNQHAENVVVWQPIGRGEVLPAEVRHVRSRRQQGNRKHTQQQRNHQCRFHQETPCPPCLRREYSSTTTARRDFIGSSGTRSDRSTHPSANRL